MNETISNILSYLAYDPSRPLLFNTALFFILFTAFFAIYRKLIDRLTLRLIATICFSLYFYYKSSGMCVAILIGISILDYVLGQLLVRFKDDTVRRVLVGLNVAINLGMLTYFKYFNMLCDTFASIFSVNFEPFDIILPAGISFFCFRSISYIVDIYRGTIKPCDNVLHYVFFLTFFPPLLAGPVVRAKTLLPQIARNHKPTQIQISTAFFFIICGLIKKVVIADYISCGFIDRVFDDPTLYTGLENVIATYGFTLQLYCDFSGYSDMAIGIALLLGYKFDANFNAPLVSQNPTEFWHRWHISLSTWLRDYLYIPLGGSRKGTFRSHINLMITMTLGGLWHGASWMYIIWGAWNGILLVAHKLWCKLLHLQKNEHVGVTRHIINVIFTFTFMAFGFMFFRADSMEKVGEMLTQIFTAFHPEVAAQVFKGYTSIIIIMALGLILHFTPQRWMNALIYRFSTLSTLSKAIILSIAIFIAIQVSSSDLVPFIYLQY